MTTKCAFACAVFLATVGALLPLRDVNARPKFGKVFESQYKTYYEGGTIKTDSCTVCHQAGDESKKTMNIYGDALKKVIAKSEDSEAKTREALTAVEDKDSAVIDKTFGDLIKEGRLPASKD